MICNYTDYTIIYVILLISLSWYVHVLPYNIVHIYISFIGSQVFPATKVLSIFLDLSSLRLMITYISWHRYKSPTAVYRTIVFRRGNSVILHHRFVSELFCVIHKVVCTILILSAIGFDFPKNNCSKLTKHWLTKHWFSIRIW